MIVRERKGRPSESHWPGHASRGGTERGPRGSERREELRRGVITLKPPTHKGLEPALGCRRSLFRLPARTEASFPCLDNKESLPPPGVMNYNDHHLARV